MNRNQLLYVENISPSSSEEHLITYLEKWAPVQQVYFLREKQCTKRSIAAFVRVANEADLDLLLLRNQQNYRGKRLFMVRVDQTPFFQADHTVIVRNITTKISEENLYDHFEECGKIAFLQIRTDDFAYIGFEDKSSVRNAMSKNNMPLKGSNLKIQLLTRNIEIMIVNLDTLQARMPDLYRKMILPIEPRKPGVVPQQQPQQPGNQQQHSQPAKQQPGNQQQQSQTPKQQQQHSQPAKQQFGNQQQQHSQPAKQQFGNQQQNSQPAKQQFGNQQQQSQPPKQQQQFQPRQQTGNQQQQNQRQQQPQQQQQQRGQPPQQKQPQQQPLPQRQQQKQPQPQQQPLSTIQLLKEKATAFAGKQQQQQQPQQKPPQQAPVVQPAKPTPPVQEQPKKQEAVTPVPASVPAPAPMVDFASDDTDDVQIIEPMETTEILDDESDSEIQIVMDTSPVPPIPSAYKPQPDDIMRPVKASEIEMSVAEGKTERDSRSVWVNNIQPETRRLTLVMYMEQFGDVEMCKLGTSKNCYFTQWAKVCFTSEEAAKRATEYFLHPFQGRYLFVLACNRCIDEVPGKVFVLDYLSKYLVYEDVAKSFKQVGDVFYLVRLLDNTYMVRIFFLDTVDVNAALAVKSIGGKPINVLPYKVGMDLKISNNLTQKLRLEKEVMDAEKEARMAKILEIYKKEALDRCDPVVNPDGKTEDNVVLMSNVHSSTTNQQIHAFFKSIGQPTFVRREQEPYNEGYERVYVGFRTLSMVLKATELPADKTLNDCKPFIFAACTKPHMSERNTVRLFFASKEITVQDIYNGLIHFGKIRYIEKEHTKKALIVWDSHDNGIKNCKISKGFFIGPVLCLGKDSLLGKRSHDSAFDDDCDYDSPANPDFVASSAPSRSNTPSETDRDSTFITPIPLDQQQPSVDTDVSLKVTLEDLVRSSSTFVAGTWNVAGCTQDSDRALVDHFLSTNDVMVGCLQETRLPTCTMDTSTYHWYNVNRQAQSAKWDGGTALVVRRDLLPDCTFRRVSEDICSVRLPVFGKMLTVVSVYARSSSGQVDPAIGTLQNFLSCLPTRQRANVIVLGDFNAHVGFQDLLPARDRHAVGKHLFHPWSNANGIGIKDILRGSNLRLCNSFGPCTSVQCTWSQGDQKSQTSYIIMPVVDRFHRPACRCVQEPSSFSDHRLLLFTVRHRVDSSAVGAAKSTSGIQLSKTK